MITDRLERFDDVFTEILIGLAAALLIAIGFAPQLLSTPEYKWIVQMQQGDKRFDIALDEWPEPITCPICQESRKQGITQIDREEPQKQKQGQKKTKEVTQPVVTQPVVTQPELHQQAISKHDLVCLKDGWQVDVNYLNSQASKWVSSPKSGKKLDPNNPDDIVKVVGLQRGETSFSSWWDSGQSAIIILWLFMGAFCVKLVHEQSVLRYHLSEDKLQLNKRSNVLLFLSRVFLLSMLYLVIIGVYINGYGRLVDYFWSPKLFALLLITSYIVPDWILYCYFVKHLKELAEKKNTTLTQQQREELEGVEKVEEWLKSKVIWRWVALDIVNCVITAILFAGADNKNYGVVLALVSVIAISVWVFFGNQAYGTGENPTMLNSIGEWYKDSNIPENKKGFRSVVVCIALIFVGFIIANTFKWDLLKYDNSHNAAIVVLGANLLDWIFNDRFFFDKAP